MPEPVPEHIALSFIIPAWNERENVELLLPALRETLDDLGMRWEIIVADGGSEDGTADAALQRGARVIRQRERGYAAALLEGIRESRAPFIVTMDKILEAMDLKPFSVASEAAIVENVAKVQKLYGEKGFYQAKVSYTLQPVTDTEANLILNINEGGKVYVKKINFEGNTAFKYKQLRAVMETKEKTLLSFITGTGKLDKDILERDAGKSCRLLFQQWLCQGQDR